MPETIQSCARAGILMQAYWKPEFHPVEPVGSTLADLMSLGAIESYKVDGPQQYAYRTTPLGRAWVRAMLATPLPRTAFVDATGQVIPD